MFVDVKRVFGVEETVIRRKKVKGSRADSLGKDDDDNVCGCEGGEKRGRRGRVGGCGCGWDDWR
jgi:hypothetical protein